MNLYIWVFYAIIYMPECKLYKRRSSVVWKKITFHYKVWRGPWKLPNRFQQINRIYLLFCLIITYDLRTSLFFRFNLFFGKNKYWKFVENLGVSPTIIKVFLRRFERARWLELLTSPKPHIWKQYSKSGLIWDIIIGTYIDGPKVCFSSSKEEAYINTGDETCLFRLKLKIILKSRKGYRATLGFKFKVDVYYTN